MRSIRLSLLLYFLGLLAAALGVASLLAYRTGAQTLQDKQTTAHELIEAQYRERCRQERERLDQDLLQQAQTMARMVQFQFNWGIFRVRRLSILGTLSASTAPNGHLLMPAWLGQGVHDSPFRKVYRDFYRRRFTQIKLEDDSRVQPKHPKEYYQVDSQWGGSYRSPSLGKRAFVFDPKASRFAPKQVLAHGFDTTILPDETDPPRRLRRVTLKTPVARLVPFRYFPSWSHKRPPRHGGHHGKKPTHSRREESHNKRSSKSRGRPPGPIKTPPRPSIYIQFAVDPVERDAALATHRTRRDQELETLESETLVARDRLRNQLLLTGLITFFATILGSFCLVRLGLAPLHRLSEAVSRVSARDFRLSYPHSLPSELKPIADRLNETLELLKRAFAREKQATADISHELRTPLAALLTTTELALRKPRTQEEYREFIQDCRLSAEQMNQAVERLLTLARLDAGVVVIRSRKVNVGQIATQCAAVVRPLVEAKGLRLKEPNLVGSVEQSDEALVAVALEMPDPTGGPWTDPQESQENMPREGTRPERVPFKESSQDTPEQLMLQTDPDKLREVLTNLLHNAIQYNRPGGSIELEVLPSNDALLIEVRDTGVGMSEQTREHIFERFYRADPSRGSDGIHAGLGLAIVKEYVELMGGTIEVESAEGQGSTFRVRLPRN